MHEFAAMSGRVVVGTDGSEQAVRAARWGAQWAHDAGQGLTLVSAHGPVTMAYPEAGLVNEELLAEMQRLALGTLEELRDALATDFPDLDIQVAAIDAPASLTLTDITENAALLVLGTRGLRGLKAAVLGGTADVVIAHASGPVAVVPEDHEHTGDPVVVGLDLSDSSHQALTFAADAAKILGVGLRVIHAWDLDRFWNGLQKEAMREVTTKTEQSAREGVEKAMDGFAEAHPGLQVQVDVVAGRAHEVLEKASQGASLLVVGSRGLGGFKSMLLGSTSRRVLQSSHCPSVVVHQR